MFGAKKNVFLEIAEQDRQERQARAARNELLTTASAMLIERDDVVSLMTERYPDMKEATRDALHVLYNTVHAELAINRARALIDAIDKE